MKPANPRLSIIIPTLNEAGNIGALLSYLRLHISEHRLAEIIVVDGGSSDDTMEVARQPDIKVLSSERGRAVQMNLGAIKSRGDILYFLHADTYPPPLFEKAILEGVANGHEAGCFRMQFDSDNAFLGLFSWFTRFNFGFFRGGDQSLYVTRKLFLQSGGFNESYQVYEDNEYTCRLYRHTRFTVLSEKVVTSARRYRKIPILKLQFHFGIIHLKNYLGAGPEDLYRYYRKNIAL